MTHDIAHAIGYALWSATGLLIAGAPQVPMSDEMVLGVSIGAGLIGGIVSTLIADGAITARELLKRMIASGMASGAMVAGVIIYTMPEPRLLAVGGLALGAGIVAWPVSQTLPKLAPSILRDGLRKWLKDWLGGPK